jgi:hypothetical protein
VRRAGERSRPVRFRSDPARIRGSIAAVVSRFTNDGAADSGLAKLDETLELTAIARDAGADAVLSSAAALRRHLRSAVA